MTAIRRPTATRNPHRRRNGNVNSSTLRTCRNVIGVTILIASSLYLCYTSNSNSGSNNSKNDHSAGNGKINNNDYGILGALDNSKVNLSLENKKNRLQGGTVNVSPDNAKNDSPSRSDESYDQEIKDVVEEILDQKGSRTTENGYIADYQYERHNESFRQGLAPQVNKWQEEVAKLIDEPNLRSCLYLDNSNAHQSKPKLLLHTNCRQREDEGEQTGNIQLIVHNTQPFQRTLCGKNIAPHSAEHIDIQSTACQDLVVRLFPENKPPIVILDGVQSNSKQALHDVECDVPCQYQEPADNSKVRTIDGTNWKVNVWESDPYGKKIAQNEPTDYRRDQFYSNVNFKSTIPLSSFTFDSNNIQTPSISFETSSEAASYLVTDNCSSNRRNKWAYGMAKSHQVKAYGECENNEKVPAGKSLQNKADRIELLKKYRFNLAFETSNSEKDYITGIVWEALEAGTIPIVFGAVNIKDHVPKNSVISTGEFQHPEALATYVKKVAQDKSLWESYHAWRNDPDEIQAFNERYQFVSTGSTCRMCRWAHAKKYGNGWNHQKQTIGETTIPRKLCLDSSSGKEQTAISPFRETYTLVDSSNRKSIRAAGTNFTRCNPSTESQSSISIIDLGDGNTVRRTILEHDGVTDMLIHGVETNMSGSEDLVLRLQIPVENSEGAHFRSTHATVATLTENSAFASSITIQDERVRVTFLVSWETNLSCKEEGVVEIVLQSREEGSFHTDEIKRIRVVVEDLNSVEDKMTEFYPSNFLQLMIKDFVDPLLLFYVD